MKRASTAAVAGALLLLLFGSMGVPSATAQEGAEGLSPVSIYSLDDGSVDDTVSDPSLTTESGTIEGGAQPTEDRFGNPTGALACDGVDDFVQTKEDSNKNPLTFSVWFRADDVSGEHSIVDSDSSGRYGHSLIIGYDDPNDPNDTPNDGSLSIQYHDGVWDTDVKINEGEWTHVFVTYSGDKIRVYVGTENRPTELVAERDYDTSAGFDGGDFRFCRHNPDDPQFFKGAIDDVRFYDAALTPEEIGEVHEEQSTTTTTEPDASQDAPPAPVCPKNPPSNVYGDVHVRTPDSLVYDFQFTGDFLIAESEDGDAVIQTRMEPWAANPDVSVNTKAALDVAGDTLEFDVDPDNPFVLNGEPTDMPTEDLTLPNGGTIRVGKPASGFRDNVTIDWPDEGTQAVVRISKRPFLDVGLCRLDQTDEYEGLVGNLNGDPNDDMQVRDGDVVEQPASVEDLAEFGDSWRVDPDESLFDVPMPASDHVTPNKVITIEDLPEDALAEAEKVCDDMGIDEPLAKHQCAYDVASTGEDAFAESADVQQEAVEALPESAPEPVAAVQGIAPAEIALAGSETPSDSSTDDGSDGLNPALLALLGAAGVGLVAAIVVLVMKNRKTPPAGPSGPTGLSGPAGPPGPAGPSDSSGPADPADPVRKPRTPFNTGI